MAKRGIPDFRRQQARQLRRRPTVVGARSWLGRWQPRRLGLAHDPDDELACGRGGDAVGHARRDGTPANEG